MKKRWVLAGAGAVVGLGLLATYQYQTSAVSQYDYPVQKPVAKVTVIIPAFNEQGCIEKALVSLLKQNIVHAYPDMFEFIVVDNGSTDDTSEVAGKYAKVISSPKGVLTARNAGADAAQGEIFVFVDADAQSAPNFLNLLLAPFKDPNVVAVGGSAQPLNADILTKLAFTLVNASNVLLWGSATAVRKSAFFAVGGYKTYMNQQKIMDVSKENEHEFRDRLSKIGKVVHEARATIFIMPRRYYCVNCKDNSCPYYSYCREINAGIR